jgi:hypothetical protein
VLRTRFRKKKGEINYNEENSITKDFFGTMTRLVAGKPATISGRGKNSSPLHTPSQILGSTQLPIKLITRTFPSGKVTVALRHLQSNISLHLVNIGNSLIHITGVNKSKSTRCTGHVAIK